MHHMSFLNVRRNRMKETHQREDLMTAEDFRRIALSMPEATAAAHQGHPEFRIAGKIFANLSLEEEGYGVLFLDESQQSELLKTAPDIFSPLPGGLGRKGSTRVFLASITQEALEEAMRNAWKKRAPKELIGRA